jgi:hypothetical protein
MKRIIRAVKKSFYPRRLPSFSGKLEILGLTIAAIAAAQTPAEAQLPIIAGRPTNQVVWAGSVAKFAVTVSSMGPFTCQWKHNGMRHSTCTHSQVIDYKWSG